MISNYCEYLLFLNAVLWTFTLNSYATATTCRTPLGALGDQIPFEQCGPMVDFMSHIFTAEQKKFFLKSFVNLQKPVRAFKSVGAEILRNQADFCGDNVRKRISFGAESSFLAHPWSVLLVYDSKPRFQCGGTLITNRYVLTAGHCATRNLIFVRLGEHNIDLDIDCELDEMGQQHCLAPAVDVSIAQVIRHPSYSTADYTNDIALLRLSVPIRFTSSVKPICIPQYKYQVFGNQWGIISGWGATENSSFSNVHREALIPIISRERCQQVHRRRNVDITKLCTGGIAGEDTCQADSGGLLFVRVEEQNGMRKFRYMQVGVILAGYGKCGTNQNIPAIYTNIAWYVDWIADNLKM